LSKHKENAMTTINISLPESMRDFVNQQVAQGGYSTVSEYVRQLIREEQKQAGQKRIEALLLEGLNSGEPKEMTPEDWKELERRIWQRHAEGQYHATARDS
jgi:antitoxin ParD1/3/4